MKRHTILFHLVDATELPRRRGAPFIYSLVGDTINGHMLAMETTRIGKGERRWNPVGLVGTFLKITCHITARGNLKADLWRTSLDEDEDLADQFAKARTRYLVQEERAALQAALVEDGKLIANSTARMRL